MRKIVLIGPCGGGGVPKNGASAKNYHLLRYLQEKNLHVVTVDTENWKRNPFVVFRLLFHLLFSPHATFILAANSLSCYKVIRLFYKMPQRIHLVYWAIGGCIADWIKITNRLMFPRLMSTLLFASYSCRALSQRKGVTQSSMR